MATIALLYSSETAMTVTGLHSLGDSATAGWQSAVVDNTSNLYVDALVQVVIDFANTAPAGDKTVYVFSYGGTNATYTNPASGTEGAITVVSMDTNPMAFKLIGVLPYTTQDEVGESQPFSVAAAFGGVLPPKWGIVVMNRSGAGFAASGNSVKWVGVKLTSA